MVQLCKNGVAENVNAQVAHGFVALDFRELHVNLLLSDVFDQRLLVEVQDALLQVSLAILAPAQLGEILAVLADPFDLHAPPLPVLLVFLSLNIALNEVLQEALPRRVVENRCRAVTRLDLPLQLREVTLGLLLSLF